MKHGDRIELAHHRLVYGDAFNSGHVDLLMQGEKADMLYCSLPSAPTLPRLLARPADTSALRIDGGVDRVEQMAMRTMCLLQDAAAPVVLVGSDWLQVARVHACSAVAKMIKLHACRYLFSQPLIDDAMSQQVSPRLPCVSVSVAVLSALPYLASRRRVYGVLHGRFAPVVSGDEPVRFVLDGAPCSARLSSGLRLLSAATLTQASGYFDIISGNPQISHTDFGCSLKSQATQRLRLPYFTGDYQ